MVCPTQLKNLSNENKNKVLPSYVEFPGKKLGCYRLSHFLLFSDTVERKMMGCQALLSKRCISSCLVLILHRQLRKCLLSARKSYYQIAKHICKTSSNSVFDTFQQFAYSIRPRRACWTQSCCWSLVDIWCKIVSSLGRNPTSVTSLLDGHQTPAIIASDTCCNTHASTMCLSNTWKLSLPKNKSFLCNSMCCLLLARNRCDIQDPLHFLLKAHYTINMPSNKTLCKY